MENNEKTELEFKNDTERKLFELFRQQYVFGKENLFKDPLRSTSTQELHCSTTSTQELPSATTSTQSNANILHKPSAKILPETSKRRSAQKLPGALKRKLPAPEQEGPETSIPRKATTLYKPLAKILAETPKQSSTPFIQRSISIGCDCPQPTHLAPPPFQQESSNLYTSAQQWPNPSALPLRFPLSSTLPQQFSASSAFSPIFPPEYHFPPLYQQAYPPLFPLQQRFPGPHPPGSLMPVPYTQNQPTYLQGFQGLSEEVPQQMSQNVNDYLDWHSGDNERRLQSSYQQDRHEG